MICGFTFKNRHCSEFGIIAKTKSSVLIPQIKEYSYSPALYDGSIDFSESNPYGRAFYEDRTIELELQFSAENLASLSAKAARVAAWLCGSGYLEFDNANGSRWYGRAAAQTDFVPELGGKKAIVCVIFSVSPTGEGDFEAGGEHRISSGIRLSSAFPLDISSRFCEIALKQGNNKLKFLNIGDFYVRPVFSFGTGADMISICMGEKNITVNSIGDRKITVDFKRHTAYDEYGENFMDKLSGEFFEFPAGISEYSVYCNRNTVMDIKYVPLCIYDFDFSETKWEAVDAEIV